MSEEKAAEKTPAARKSPTKKPNSVHAKIAAVIGLAEDVPKAGYNEKQDYPYATESDVLRAVRQHVADQHLSILPKVESFEDAPAGKSRLVKMHFTYTITDGDTGHSVEIPWIGEAADWSDKAIWKCYTGSTKAFLRTVFMLASGDEPEKDSPEVVDQQSPAPPPPPQPRSSLLTEEQEKTLMRLPDAMPIIEQNGLFESEKEREFMQQLLADWENRGRMLPMGKRRWEYFQELWAKYTTVMRTRKEGE